MFMEDEKKNANIPAAVYAKEYQEVTPDLKEQFVQMAFGGIYIKLDQIELPENHRQRVVGDVVRAEKALYEKAQHFTKPVVCVKTSNAEKPYRLYRGDSRFDAAADLQLDVIKAVLDNR